MLLSGLVFASIKLAAHVQNVDKHSGTALFTLGNALLVSCLHTTGKKLHKQLTKQTLFFALELA
jgi:hypothetical protein